MLVSKTTDFFYVELMRGIWEKPPKSRAHFVDVFSMKYNLMFELDG